MALLPVRFRFDAQNFQTKRGFDKYHPDVLIAKIIQILDSWIVFEICYVSDWI